jgi:glycine/D-amino acid oxidase-like deaminating enzyme
LLHTQILIIGQGLCGSWLSYYLQKEGIDILVIDDERKYAASKVASGIINPVTGRRHVKTWLIDALMPFAVNAYQEMDASLIRQKNILDFFPTHQMKDSFLNRICEKDNPFLRENDHDWKQFFRYSFGVGEINPCWLVNVHAFLEKQKQNLLAGNVLIRERFEQENLRVENGMIRYQDLTAEKIIFCDGISSFQNPFFKSLPFVFNKGEALIIDCPGLPAENVFKSGISIVPWKENIFWVGSNFEWDYTHEGPSTSFKEQTEARLQSFLIPGFKILDHMAGVRPANKERRPFAGFHPQYKNVGILNGMGSKGISLTPWLGYGLAQNIIHGSGIHAEATVDRFSLH